MRDSEHRFVLPFHRIAVSGAVTSLSFLVIGCAAWSSHLSSRSFRVFSGFVLVASGPYKGRPNGAHAEAIAKHGTRELTLPERPEVGIQYVFLHRRPLDSEKLALTDLPNRLRSAGITVTQAPASSRDLMHLFIGGPLFTIRIREGRHEGLIYNQLDTELLQTSGGDQQWEIENYVLVWLT